MKELTLHYSAHFETLPIPIHVETTVSRVTERNIERNKDAVIRRMRGNLLEAMRKLRLKADDLMLYEVYYFINGKEFNLFKYEKG